MFLSPAVAPREAHKDSRRNAETDWRVSSVNVVADAQRLAMNETSAEVAPEVDEFALAGLEGLPSRLVKPPRVAGAPAHFECRHLQDRRAAGRTIPIRPTRSCWAW